MKKNKIFVMIMIFSLLIAVFPSDKSSAASINEIGQGQSIAEVKITNPETNEVYIKEITIERPNIAPKMLLSADGEEIIDTAYVEVNLTEAIIDTLSPAERVMYDETVTKGGLTTTDITITAQITFVQNAANNSVALRSVSGTYGTSGMFYPKSGRIVHFSNTNHFAYEYHEPTSNSWSYIALDQNAYSYTSFAPPYVLSMCEIGIIDMSATRHIEVLVKV